MSESVQPAASPPTDSPVNPAADGSPDTPPDLKRVNDHLDHAVKALLDLQFDQGYWCAELEGDSILESEFLLFKWIIGQEDDPRLPRIANYLRTLQQADGSWVQYPGAGIDLSATVKGYFALKLMGDNTEAPHMQRARKIIGENGGAEQCNSFSNFYLAALGQISYNAVPSIPPEIVYLPKWFYFNLDKVSAWTRTMITPLSIVTSKKPVRKLPEGMGIDELYLDDARRHRLIPTTLSEDHGHRTWTRVFHSIDKVIKLIEKTGITPLRKRALKRIENWIIERTDRSDGLGAIFPPMVYILIALKALDYPDDHPKVLEAHKHLDGLMIHDPDKDQIRFQPCWSPIWDTGIAAYALTEAGLDQHSEPMKRCADWLNEKECRIPGDWVANVKHPVEPSGWYFEFENGFYPDVDDTAMVAMSLKRIGGSDAVNAAARGVQWLLAMQNDDGGWAAFDRTVERPILEHVPFADHNAIQDPSCADITGRTLECLGHHAFTTQEPSVIKAIEFLKRKQEPEGCWFGRWGVNYIYGSWQALGGLEKIGYDMSQPWVRKAGDWLKSVQQPDGSFGESANSYEDTSLKGQGPSTASQTAWAAMSIMSVYGPHDSSLPKAIRWLCDTQLQADNPDTDDKAGSWVEPWFTGTGFPRVFYLRYHLYRLYFPVMCLAKWLKMQQALGSK